MQDNSHFWQRLVGRTLRNRYRLDRYIARGGMGAVYRGYDLTLRRAVAVKVIIAALQPEPEVERYRKRFRQEAAAAARIRNHPNVVVVHDSGTDEEVDFLVMELLEG